MILCDDYTYIVENEIATVHPSYDYGLLDITTKHGKCYTIHPRPGETLGECLSRILALLGEPR